MIGTEKEPLGIMAIEQAMERAEEEGVDLLLVTPDATPPVCRLMDYSKFKYEQEKNIKDAQKKQRENR